jgi:hypothetical protein
MAELTQETLCSNECGDIVYFRQLDLYGYYHRDKNDGKTDDCTYYFKFRDHEVIPYTFFYGNPDTYDAGDALAVDGHSWVYDEDFHTAEYQQYIINCLYQCVCTYAFERV